MPGSPKVRLRATALNVRRILTAVITVVTSVLFIAGGSAHPATFGGILFLLLGVAGLVVSLWGGRRRWE